MAQTHIKLLRCFFFQRFTTLMSCKRLRIQVSTSTVFQLAMTKPWGRTLDLLRVQHFHCSQVTLGKRSNRSSPLQRRLIGRCVWKTVALLLGSFLARSVGRKWELSNVYKVICNLGTDIEVRYTR